MACVEDICGCRTGDHCANGETCLDSKCTGCTPDCANKCGGAPDGCGGSCNGACPPGYWCEEGVCRACDQDDHCGASCQNCASSRDGKVCIDGRCGCYTEFDCGPGARCEDQRCIAQDEPRPDGDLLDGDGDQDAGYDAGHDAGVDAGTDVGEDEEADGW